MLNRSRRAWRRNGPDMKVKLNRKEIDVEGRMRAGDLLKKMDLLPETVLVARNGEVITEDEMLDADDRVEIIRAISGGADAKFSPPWQGSGRSHRTLLAGSVAETLPGSPMRGSSLAPAPEPEPDGEGDEPDSGYRIPIREWPEGERPREKLLEAGAESLTEAELLGILLRTGVSGKSAVDLARSLLKSVGGLHGLVRSDPFDLTRVKGMGRAKAAQVMAALELSRRAASAGGTPVTYIRSSKDVSFLVAPTMRDMRKEALDVLFLNSKNRVLARERLSRGTVNRSSVFAREVVERALKRSAAAMILVHNHPSGDPAPSAEDERITRELVWAGELMNLCVLDHVIVGGTTCFSFADEGRIDRYRREMEGKQK